jgi:hypothetical protein
MLKAHTRKSRLAVTKCSSLICRSVNDNKKLSEQAFTDKPNAFRISVEPTRVELIEGIVIA